MIQTLHAEFRKLLSVRSTYVISGLALALVAFIAFYGVGYKGGPVFDPQTLQSFSLNALMITGTFVGVASILVICHEYRYNTIAYSLTSSNSRMKVLLAKMITVAVLAVVMALLTLLLSICLPGLGAKVAGNNLGLQTIDAYSVLWRSLVFVLGSAWLGLVFGFLSRSVVFAIVAYFLIPTLEPILHALLKVSNNYLPISAQNQIMQTTSTPGMFSPLASAGVFAAYLAIGLIVSSVLFARRDAMS